MIHYPGFNKIAFEIGPFGSFGPLKVHWYGIMYLIAFATAWFLARVRAKKPGSNWSPVDVDDFLFFCMLGVILGGRLGYVFFYGLQFWATDPWYPLKITDGGMSFHGGLIGVLIALAIFAVRRKRKIADVFDFAAPLPGIGLFAGRIGNFINGELWGKPTDWKFGFLVKDPNSGELVGRHASQLYEAGLEGLALFALVWWFARKPRSAGAVVGVALAWYGIVRFLIEFVRVPDTQIGYLAGGWFTMGQLLSLPMILAGA